MPTAQGRIFRHTPVRGRVPCIECPVGDADGGGADFSPICSRIGCSVFYLYVTAPGMPAQKFLLDKPVCTIGRSSMNDLPISDKMLSRQHARIVRDGNGGLTVEDLGSRNGTFLNGERLVTTQ